jgi:hypothetical protein
MVSRLERMFKLIEPTGDPVSDMAMFGRADCAGRCIASGRFRAGDPILVAHQMWLGVHGTVSIELGGYLVDPYDADRCL